MDKIDIADFSIDDTRCFMICVFYATNSKREEGKLITQGGNKMESQQYKDRIAVDPDIMLGKPVIKGTRVTIELILKKLSEGMTVGELLEAYPHLTKEDIFAALSYSADVISQEELIAS